MVNCDKCNYTIKALDRFCRNCGVELSETLIDEVNLESKTANVENGISKSILEESILTEINVSESKNRNTEATEEEALSNLEKSGYKLNFKDIIAKEEIRVIFILFITIFIFISAVVAKNNIFIYKETHGIYDNAFIATEGNNVYYTNINNQLSPTSSTAPKVSTYKITGKKAEKIFDDFALFLNVKNNWLYYMENTDKNSIYKIRTNGKEKQKLFNGSAMYLKVEGDFIYYMSYNNIPYTYELNRMKLDGTDQRKISSDVACYQVIGNFIYYSSSNELGAVYRMNLDGSDKTKLCTIDGSILYVKDGYIYYRGQEGNTLHSEFTSNAGTSEDDELKKMAFLYGNGYLCRAKIDGSEKETLIKKSTNTFDIVFCNNFIIYHDAIKGFYKLNLNGKNEVLILDQTPDIQQFSIINNYMYYFNGKENKLYKKSLNSKEVIAIDLTSK